MWKLAALLGLSMFVLLPVHADVLIKKKEAALPQADEITFRGISRGAGIKLVSPAAEGQAVSSPFHLKLVFEPHGGAKIDPSSVQVDYLKSPTVDLTERVKKGVTENGIEMLKAEAPPGEHRLRVSVTDSNGQTSRSEITLKVVK